MQLIKVISGRNKHFSNKQH